MNRKGDKDHGSDDIEEDREDAEGCRGKHGLAGTLIVLVIRVVARGEHFTGDISHVVGRFGNASNRGQGPECDRKAYPDTLDLGVDCPSRLLANDKDQSRDGGHEREDKRADGNTRHLASIRRIWICRQVETATDDDDEAAEEGSNLHQEQGEGRWREIHRRWCSCC